MLEQVIAKVRLILKDAQQKLSVESAAAIEQVYNDIMAINEFIRQELSAVESNPNLDESDQKAARCRVFEYASRKLEVTKAKRNYSPPREVPTVKSAVQPVEEIALLKYLREKEVRDRLCSMTEVQIISFFGESLYDGSNPLLLNAILNAPAGFEPVSQKTLKQMQTTGAKKIGSATGSEPESVHNLNLSVREMFSLVKKELDNLRRKELPSVLTQSKVLTERPFKF